MIVKIANGGVIVKAVALMKAKVNMKENLQKVIGAKVLKCYLNTSTKQTHLCKNNGVFVRYIFDGKNFIALEDRELLKSASSTLPFSGYVKSCKEILDKGQSRGRWSLYYRSRWRGRRGSI